MSENRPESENRSDLENVENPSGAVSHESDTPDSPRPKRRILIGSQRNPDAYRPKSLGDIVSGDAVETLRPQTVSVAPPEKTQDTLANDAPVAETFDGDGNDDTAEFSSGDEPHETDLNSDKSAEPKQPPRRPKIPVVVDEDAEDETADHLSEDGLKKLQALPIPPVGKVPIPSRRGPLSGDLEAEFDQLFAGTEIDSLLEGADAVASQAMIEPETKLKAKILRQGREQVFFDLGGRNEGMLSLRMFADDECPKVGDEMEVIVSRFLPEEGLYELTRPLAAADVKDWAQVHEDMVVEALVTKANTGGAECMVNRLRGFIPISQLAQFRVENAEDFVGQKLTCVVIECDPASRNLVLSRRSMIEREREELRQKTLDELEVGQTREGIVRKIIDVGAFVDLGGVDGFIHISGLSWGRVRHPGEVLQEGRGVKVKVTKIDLENNRISLTYRDDAANPWTNIFEQFQEKSPARGKVVKIMDFGAFVELVPGVEGLVHISELSHKRVGSVGEVVREGDWVDVYIQSIDPTAKRISLSMKQLMPEPKREEDEAGDSDSGDRSVRTTSGKGKGRKEDQEPVAEPLKIKNPRKGPLKGGTDGKSDGDRFGLKW